MKLLGLKLLTKLAKKKKGDVKLQKAVDQFIDDVRQARWKNKEEVLAARGDADCVHNDGFYFFDLEVHRTMVLIEYDDRNEEDDEDEGNGIVNVLWADTHDAYERTFGNNKNTIKKWLKDRGYVE